ncbi:putative E3 ubiquitin-protein ligase ipaH4.5 [compost metagenome]
MIRELYPSYTDADIREYLANYRLSRLDVRTVLLRRREELAHLDGLLSRWQREGVSSRQRDSRQQASMLLRQAWRRQTSGVFSPFGMRMGTSLVLDGMRIGKLPMLGERIEFDYVAELSLRNMALEEVPSSFLGRFTQVRFLDLSNNGLTEVPEAIKPMTALKALRLRGNRIRLTENTGTALENLRHLEDLDLSGNPLGRLPDFGRMTRLRRLSLRATDIVRAPHTLWGRPFLESVDLRDNRIEQLPESYFREPPAFLRSVALDGNPLSTPMRERVREHLRAPAMLGAVALDRAQEIETFWLPPASRTERQLQIWRDLRHEEGSREFFRLLERLRNTSEARLVRENLTQRVQTVLEAASESTRWRTELFELAANPRSCSDSVIHNFSALEVKVMVQYAQDQAVDADAGTVLLHLARRLFRLEQVEAVAQADIAARAQDVVDPLEVSLAYRIGLARRLELPGQPQSMTFDHIAGVTPALLDRAEQDVLRQESTDAWPHFLVSRDFWIDYLKQRHAERFASLQAGFFKRLEDLEARQAGLTEGQYLTETKALKMEMEQAEQALLSTVSEDEIRRLTPPATM